VAASIQDDGNSLRLGGAHIDESKMSPIPCPQRVFPLIINTMTFLERSPSLMREGLPFLPLNLGMMEEGESWRPE